MNNNTPTAEQFYIQLGFMPGHHQLGYDIKTAMVEFAKIKVQEALQAASESRCLEMFGQTWYAQSLEPGTKVLDRVNITVNKEAILNSYPLDSIE